MSGNSARLRQALALVDGLRVLDESLRTDPPTTIAAGDFNAFSRRETAIRRLLAEFPDSPALLTEGTRGSLPTDHVFLRSQPGDPVRVHA